MNDREVEARHELAIRVGRSAGRVALEHFQRRGLGVERKSDGSPVTAADRDAEKHLREAIGEAFPDDAIVGEELGETTGDSGYRWLVDPIDGTRSFIHGVPLFGTLVGVEFEGRPIIGVIEMPAMDERVHARVGGGAWHAHGDEPAARAQVSSVDRLDEGCVCITGPEAFMKTGSLVVARELAGRAGLIRGWSDCYAHLLVATGRVEAALEPKISPWDVAPMIPIMTEAGGQYVDWEGKADARSPRGMSTNGLVTGELLELTRAALALEGR